MTSNVDINQASATPKVAVIARLKTLGSTLKRRVRPPPVVFPPPSWDLDDKVIHRAQSNHLPVSTNPDIEPLAFAKDLQSRIESETKDLPEGANPHEEGISNTGLDCEPVPPGLDPNLVRMLASEEVMNGSPATSSSKKKTDSIWNILSSLRGDHAVGRPLEAEEDGIMMHTPLEPDADSQVKFSVPETVQAEPSVQNPQQQPKRTAEKGVRVPSTTELSVLTTWWGYRVYFPPPVMAKLNNKAVKATARAAMIATALKWLLDKIPLLMIPPQFRATVKLLKRLSPLTGYIGIFIAWSWDRVRSLDEGNGVILSATWLLPVALVPMTWNAGDIPTSSTTEEVKNLEEARKTAERKASPGPKYQKEEQKKSWLRW